MRFQFVFDVFVSFRLKKWSVMFKIDLSQPLLSLWHFILVSIKVSHEVIKKWWRKFRNWHCE